MQGQTTDSLSFQRVVKTDNYELTVSATAFIKNPDDKTVMEEAGKSLDKIFDDSRNAFFG